MIPLISSHKNRDGETLAFLKLPLGLGVVLYPENFWGDYSARLSFRAAEWAWFDYCDSLPAHLFDAYTIENPRIIRNPAAKTWAAVKVEQFRSWLWERERNGRRRLKRNERAFLLYCFNTLAIVGGLFLLGIPQFFQAVIWAWS